MSWKGVLQDAKYAAVRVRLEARRLHSPADFGLLEHSLTHRIANGAIWSIIGAGIASGLAMVSNIACARMLGSTRFGELGVVMATTNLFTTLFTSGPSMTATRYVAEYRDADPDRAGKVIGLSTVTSLIVGLVIALLICLMAPWLSRDMLKASGLSRLLMLGATAMFFAVVNGSQTGALSGFESFKRIAAGQLDSRKYNTVIRDWGGLHLAE